jgi:hypothetical protein
MLIKHGLNLGQLLYLMPDDATYHEAYTLRDVLLRDYLGQRTEAIPRPVWDALVNECMPVIDCAAVERSR